VTCWRLTRAPAGKRLAPMLAGLVPLLRRDGELALSDDQAAPLVSRVHRSIPCPRSGWSSWPRWNCRACSRSRRTLEAAHVVQLFPGFDGAAEVGNAAGEVGMLDQQGLASGLGFLQPGDLGGNLAASGLQELGPARRRPVGGSRPRRRALPLTVPPRPATCPRLVRGHPAFVEYEHVAGAEDFAVVLQAPGERCDSARLDPASFA
jgi:hypothetical protein